MSGINIIMEACRDSTNENSPRLPCRAPAPVVGAETEPVIF